GSTYYYKISALNTVGESPLSNERSATPTVAVTAPSAPTLTAATAGNASVALAWNPPASNGGAAVSSYRVYRGSASGSETLLASLPSNITSWTNTGLSNGSTYYY